MMHLQKALISDVIYSQMVTDISDPLVSSLKRLVELYQKI